MLRVFVATEDWKDNEFCPHVTARDLSGKEEVIYLPRTRPGDPNVRNGAMLIAGQADNRLWYCLTDYMDAPIGAFQIVPEDMNIPGWKPIEQGNN